MSETMAEKFKRQQRDRLEKMMKSHIEQGPVIKHGKYFDGLAKEGLTNYVPSKHYVVIQQMRFMGSGPWLRQEKDGSILYTKRVYMFDPNQK